MRRRAIHADKRNGRSYPLGATVYPDGVNFSIYSHNAQAVELLLFDDEDAKAPAQIILLDETVNRTFFYWHVFILGLKPGQLYGYRVYGPFAPHKGHRFDGHKVLIDPYAKAICFGRNYQREAAINPGDNCAHAIKSVVVDTSTYDWEDDYPLRYDYFESVIYEMHVGGFTKHPSSGLSSDIRGTYKGLIEKIPYLQSCGITAVELMPVQQFDDQDVPPPLVNYWGYNPISFFAPHIGYSSVKTPLGVLDEFRDMVKALHRAGIEVLLDVVFNHTAEGGDEGPTYSLRGLENETYYILENDKSKYANYSGTGNSLNANRSVVRRMILDCLRYWVMEMHVDGFRFDLASVLSRDDEGRPLQNPPTLLSIESIPEIAHAKIIAEAWDAAGLYQVGSFAGNRWAEWNGHYRDDVRRFVRGDDGFVPRIASRILGSPDIYRESLLGTSRSINFVTCHDGFTLNDLVSYNNKHNETNLEDNRDGLNENYSWNCGVEGETNDPQIEELRIRQIKNLLTILMISQGTPMILMGDEIRRCQAGNNNAYCQDNELSWFNWDQLASNSALRRYVTLLIEFVQDRKLFSQEHALVIGEHHDKAHLLWHGVRLGQPDWSDESHSLAFTLHFPEYGEKLHIMLNLYWEPLTFELPPLPYGRQWMRIADTHLPTPADIVSLKTALENVYGVEESSYIVFERSVVILMAQ